MPSIDPVNPGDNIQTDINRASPGDTLLFATAEYDQQFTVDKNLILIGNGSTIKAPSTLAPTTFGSTTVHDIIDITNGAAVLMSGFTVAGPGPGQFNSIDDGIFVFGGATATITGCTVRDIRDEPLSGIQTGVGIQVGWASLGQVGHAALSNDTVQGSQKGNIVIDGAGSTAAVDSCTVLGVGPTPTIAENGIQVSRGAVGTITNCVISGHSYTGVYGGSDPLTATQSCGILFYAAGDGSSASGNVVTQNDIGIYANGAGAITLSGNTVTNNPDEGIFVDQGSTSVTANTVSGSLVGVCVASFGGNTADSVATVTSNTITANATGISLLNDTPGNPTQPQLTAHFNVIEGNTGGGVVNSTPGKADATLNWWGRNTGPNHASTGPGDPATDTTSGADVSKWLVLTLTVTPDQVLPGGTTAVVADLQHDSTGALHTEGFVPDGITVSFVAQFGSVAPPSGGMVQGQASTTYTAPASVLTDTVSATVDSETVFRPIQVAAIPTTVSLAASPNPSVHGQTVTFTATVTGASSALGVPSGIVAFFDSGTFLGSAALDSNGDATLLVKNLSVGTHTITAAYGGTADFLASVSANFNEEVEAEKEVLKGETAAAVSPDGKLIAVAYKDGTIAIFDTSKPKGVPVLAQAVEDRKAPVSSLAFSPDGKFLVTGWANGWLQFYKAATGDKDAGLHKDDVAITSVAWVSDYIAAGRADGGVLINKAGTLDLLLVKPKGAEGPAVVSVGSAGQLIAFGGKDGVLRVVTPKGTIQKEIKVGSWITAIAQSPKDNSIIAVGTKDKEVKIYEVTNSKEIATVKGDAPITSIAFSPDGKSVAVADAKGGVKLYDAMTGQETKALVEKAKTEAVSVVFTSDGKSVVVGDADGLTQLIEIATGKVTAQFTVTKSK